MRFKSSEQLIARVAKELDSFQASNQFDEGDFYRWIKEILTKLNIPAYSPVHSILPLDNTGRMRVPEDMYQLWSAWRYESGISVGNRTEKHYQNQVRWLVQENQCLSKKEGCTGLYEEGDVMVAKFYIEENIPERTITYKNKTPIRIVNYATNQCISGSPAIRNNSRLQASLDSSFFNFNFTDGHVYLQYYTLLTDDKGLPMIPDVTEVELAIENYILFRIFRKLYYNNYIDAVQRYKEAEKEYKEAMAEAEYYVKLPTFAAMVRLAESHQGRYSMFELQRNTQK